MTIQENARLTIYRLTNEYIENIDSIYLWDLAKMIKNAFLIQAINLHELENIAYQLNVSVVEILSM